MADKKDPARGPFEWLWHISLLIFGSVILLNLAWGFIQPALPYIFAAILLGAIVWIALSIRRIRKDRW